MAARAFIEWEGEVIREVIRPAPIAYPQVKKPLSSRTPEEAIRDPRVDAVRWLLGPGSPLRCGRDDR